MNKKKNWRYRQIKCGVGDLAVTKRQLQMVKLILADYTIQEIAEVLDLHSNTVQQSLQTSREIFGVSSNIGLAREFLRLGYIYEEDLLEEE